MIKQLILRFSGFSTVGAMSTLLSIGLVYIFDEVMGMWGVWGYILAYALSIVFSYAVNALVVYRAKFEIVSMLKYFATYLSGMGLGALLVWGLSSLHLGISDFLISCGVTPITMVWNFVFVNKILSKKGGC